MAKNIDFMGATFPDVPSIRLPQHEGGLVSFDDTTDATATADKILQGYTAYANGQKLVGTASGGITPSGTIQITQNGQVDVTNYATADVNVSGGGGGAEIETGTWIPSSRSITREFIPFATTHSKLPTIVILTFNQNNADYWNNNYVTKFQYIDYYQLFESGYNTQKDTADGFGYSLVEEIVWYNSATNTNVSKMMTSHNSSELGDTDKTYPRYFVRENGFYATSNFKISSYYFFKPTSATAGTWNWVAIWV